MRAKLLAGLIFLLIGVGLVQAQVLPLPIIVKLTPDPSSPFGVYNVSVTNMRTGEVMKGETNGAYEFVIDWANSKQGYQKNDHFTISILGQTKEIIYVGIPPVEFRDLSGNSADINVFVLADICPSYCIKTVYQNEPCHCGGSGCPSCNCPSCNCPDCPSCPDSYDCPTCYCEVNVCPTCPIEKTCEVCKECETCPICESNIFSQILLIILGVLAGGAGVGIVVRRNAKTGKLEVEVTKHKHKNYNFYHSIYTMHQKQPHLKGEINPTYTEEGYYVPKGGD